MILLTGDRHQGKTSLILELLARMQDQGRHVAGIASPGLWAKGQRSGFDLLELDTGLHRPLARRIPGLRPMPFMFDAVSLDKGRQALAVSRCRPADLVIVDEIGPFELRGGGWAACLPPLLYLSGPVHLWVVRRSLVQAVQDHFRVQARVRDIAHPQCLARLIRDINSGR